MLRRGITRTGSGEPFLPACSNCGGWRRPRLASALHVKCCRGQEVAVRHRNGMFLPSSRSSLQRGPEIIWDHQHALFFFFFTSLHLLLPLYCWQHISQLCGAKSSTLALWFNGDDSHGNWKMYDHTEKQVVLDSASLWIDAFNKLKSVINCFSDWAAFHLSAHKDNRTLTTHQGLCRHRRRHVP